MWGRSVTGAPPTPSLPFEVNGMATLTSVNDQITDATRSRTHAALGDVLVSLTQSAGISYQNAVNAQQQAFINAQAYIFAVMKLPVASGAGVATPPRWRSSTARSGRPPTRHRKPAWWA